MADADPGPDLEPPYRLPSPDSPFAPPVLRKPKPEDGADQGEAQLDDSDRGTMSSAATPTTTRPETPQGRGGEPSSSSRRGWGLRSPIMLNRLSFYSDSSRSPLSPMRQLSSSLMPSPAGVSKDGAGDADDELDADELEGVDMGSDTDSLTQDSKDVLVERLDDLVQNLTAGRRLQAADIAALHAKVDEIEGLVPAARQINTQRKRELPPSPPRQDSRRARLGSPLPVVQQGHRARPAETPTEPLVPLLSSQEASLLPAAVPPSPTPDLGDGTPKPDVAARVTAEAEKLNAELTQVFENMKARSIESNHLHRLLIERAEGAAMRIMELERELSELVGTLDDSKADLKHLRLRLRAIESMFDERIAQEADPVLYQSIEDWKADWASLRERMSRERQSQRPQGATNDDTPATNLSTIIGRDGSSRDDESMN